MQKSAIKWIVIAIIAIAVVYGAFVFDVFRSDAPVIDTPVTEEPLPTATTTEPVAGACIVSGCSGEICSDQDMMSNCMYRPEFQCYKKATCERQANGQCGWTQTASLAACLKAPPQE